eukprot:3238337-Prymnesium_polylepis.1
MRTQPGVEEVYLAKRVGFVKLAMQHQAALVPCYAFGTTDLYDITPAQHKANSKGFLWTLSKKYGVAMPVRRPVSSLSCRSRGREISAPRVVALE